MNDQPSSDSLETNNTSDNQMNETVTIPPSSASNNKPSSKSQLSLKSLPDLLTVREVAQVLRVSILTVKRWGKKGKLPFIRINSRGDRRYRKETVLYALGIDPESLK